MPDAVDLPSGGMAWSEGSARDSPDVVDGVKHASEPGGGRGAGLKQGGVGDRRERGTKCMQPSALVGPRKEDRGEHDQQSSYFECNICLELAQDPVVTQCGHLYCWPCLYKWLQVFSEEQQCPVCKAGLSEDLVIPVYGRGCGRRRPHADIPLRPSGLRLPPRPQTGDVDWGILGRVPMQTQMPISKFSFINSLLGFGYQCGVGMRTMLMGKPLSRAQQQQAFLSRLLLLLGSFVIMCLLIF